MKDLKFLVIVCIAVFCCVNFAQAQNDNDLAITTEKKGAFNESADESKEIVEEEIPYYYRQHKKLPTFYTGFVIELTTSDLPLRRDYSLFEKFGNVFVDHMEKEGGYSYMITGFRNEKAAESFLKNIVIHRANEAKVIYYNKGERKLKK